MVCACKKRQVITSRPVPLCGACAEAYFAGLLDCAKRQRATQTIGLTAHEQQAMVDELATTWRILNREDTFRSKISARECQAIRELIAAGALRSELAKRYGVREQTIGNIAKGVERLTRLYPRQSLTKTDRERIRIDLLSGVTAAEIKRRYGISTSTVYTYLPVRRRNRPKATTEEIDLMRRMHACGLSQTAIGKILGVYRTTVGRVVRMPKKEVAA